MMSSPDPAADRTMVYAGMCCVCETGPLGLRMCGACEKIVLLCDECDAAWTSAAIDSPPHFASDPDLPCPYCQASLLAEPSRWAKLAEGEAVAWIAEAVADGRLQLKQGEPLR